MNRIYMFIGTLLWLISIMLLGRLAYTATFGTSTFGTDKWGSGSTTTSEYVPGYQKNRIIGGGLVKLIPKESKDIDSDSWNRDVKFSLVYKINKEDLK